MRWHGDVLRAWIGSFFIANILWAGPQSPPALNAKLIGNVADCSGALVASADLGFLAITTSDNLKLAARGDLTQFTQASLAQIGIVAARFRANGPGISVAYSNGSLEVFDTASLPLRAARAQR